MTSPDDALLASGLLGLGEDPPAEAVERALRELGKQAQGADALRREVLREGAIKALAAASIRSPARLVDAVLGASEAKEDDTGQGRRLVLADVEPWPDPVDGAALLDELERAYLRYLAMPGGGSVASALYVLYAHAHDAAECSPILAYTSAAPRCGKTTALTITGALTPRSLAVASISAAALYRLVERSRPTLLIDEAEDLGTDDLAAEVRRVLRAGHTPATAYVSRCEGDDHEPRTYSVWAPRVVALIGRLKGALGDRTLEVRMEHRRPDEPVERLRVGRIHAELEPLARRCARWAADHLDELRDADPEIPAALHDRAADCWRPLLAIADLAGGPWPQRVRDAALLLAGLALDHDDAVGPMVLADLCGIMDGHERIASAEAVRLLVGLGAERPWSEWRRGQPITERQLARLLSPYGVRPRQLWDPAAGKIRGYVREHLVDVWVRYLPPSDPVGAVDARIGADDRPVGESVGGSGATGSPSGGISSTDAILPPLPDRDPPPELCGDYEAAEREALQAEGEL